MSRRKGVDLSIGGEQQMSEKETGGRRKREFVSLGRRGASFFLRLRSPLADKKPKAFC